MPTLIVPGSWQSATHGKAHIELPGANLRELLEAFVESHPDASYRLYSPAGSLLDYHLFVVNGVQVPRLTPPGDVDLDQGSRIEIIPPLVGG